MSYSTITIHDIKTVDVSKREHKDDDGNVKYTVLKIEMRDAKGENFELTAFLNKGEEGYTVNLVQNYKTRTGSYELVRVFLRP